MAEVLHERDSSEHTAVPEHRRAKIRYWLLYLSTVTVVICLILEGAVRLLGIAPPLPAHVSVADPYLPYKPLPLSVGYAHTKEFDCEYRHNSLGFRDVEHSLDKPKGVFRILALGDSFTYGSGVSFQDTYLRRLERMLNSREGQHPKVEIINAGIYRYFPEPERILLEHYGVNFSPDLIILAFLPNDIVDTHLGIDAVKINQSGQLITRGAQGTGRLTTFLYTHSHVFRILFNRFNPPGDNGAQHLIWDDIYKPDWFFEKDWKTVESEYQKIVGIADAIKAHVVLMHIPQQGPWDEKHSYPALRLGEWSARNGVTFVDTLPAMKEASKVNRLYYEVDGHCRPAGHEVIAQTLFEKLTGEQLVP
jgi:hypothetical protein